MKKWGLYCLAGILAVICITIVSFHFLQHRDPGIRQGITMREAETRANSQDGYFADEFNTAQSDHQKSPQALLAEQTIDDTHRAFLVDTGGRLGTLLVTAELDKGTATEFSLGTIRFTVWDPKAMDTPLQTMTADTEIYLEWNVIDANFDGYMDLTCTYFRGNQPTYDHLWLWNEEQGLFERVPEFSEISMPYPDGETKTIIGFARSSAASDGLNTFHRWVDGELVCVRRIESVAYQDYASVLVEDRIDGALRQVYYQEFPQNAAETAGQETWRRVRELWLDLDYHGAAEGLIE